MTFANVEDIAGYAKLLSDSGCEVRAAEDTGRFPPYADLYLDMIEMQLMYDALRPLGFRTDLLETFIAGFRSWARWRARARSRRLVSSHVAARGL